MYFQIQSETETIDFPVDFDMAAVRGVMRPGGVAVAPIKSFGLPFLRLRVTAYSENFTVYCENLAVDADTWPDVVLLAAAIGRK